MLSPIVNEELQALLAVLPNNVRESLIQQKRFAELIEVVMDLGRQPTARYTDGEVVLNQNEITQAEIEAVVNHIEAFDDDNRAGIARTLHRIAGMKNRRGEVVGLTCRIGRTVYGTLETIEDIVGEGKSILLLGRPGVGKTTMLREMARVLSENKRVIIVDTSNEIGGDGDIPHPAVGKARRMQVPKPIYQHETMIEAVENHNPEVIIIDEIGREQEAQAARTINERGVQLVGTAHGKTLQNLLLNPTLSDLIGGIESVTLSDEEARRRGTQKTVLERRSSPTFDVLIEIQDRQNLIVHRDVAASVDASLRNQVVNVELRSRKEDGEVHIEKQQLQPEPSSLSRRSNKTNNKERESSRAGKNSNHTHTIDVDLPTLQSDQKLRIFAYGVARNRLMQASHALGVKIELVEDVNRTDVFVTLKSYYRRRRRVIQEVEQLRKPIYVLRANSDAQIKNFLIEAFNLRATVDPFEEAIAETEEAINLIRAGQHIIDLNPAGKAVRRYQHQLAKQANLVSHSYGNEPNRHVRIFSTPRNDIAPLPDSKKNGS